MRLKKMNYILPILLSLVVIASCAKNTPPVNIPPAPQERESARPDLANVQSNIDQSLRNNIEIMGKVKNQKNLTDAQQNNIKIAINKASELQQKIKSGNSVTNEDIDLLISYMNKVERHSLVLEKEIDELIELIKKQDIMLSEAVKNARLAMNKVIDKDREVRELRDQNKFLGVNLNLKNIENEKLKKSKATNSTYKRLFWYFVLGFAAWTIIKNLLMIYLPSTKFRI